MKTKLWSEQKLLRQDLGLCFLIRIGTNIGRKSITWNLRKLHLFCFACPLPTHLCTPFSLSVFICGTPDSLVFSAWFAIYLRSFRLKAYYLNPTLAKQSAVYILKCELFYPQQGNIYMYDASQECISCYFPFSFRRNFWRKDFFITSILKPALLEF